MVFVTGGYKVFGDPPDIDLDNVAYGSFGLGYKFSRSFSAGLIADYREAAFETSVEQKEGMAYFSLKIGKKTKLLGYYIKGYTDGSPDWGLGTQLSQSY